MPSSQDALTIGESSLKPAASWVNERLEGLADEPRPPLLPLVGDDALDSRFEGITLY